MEPFPVDEDGFLDSSISVASTTDSLSPGMLVEPTAAASVGPLVLLGEPGVGKTTVFENLTDGLSEVGEATPDEPSVLILDAVRLTDSTFDALLGRYLRQFRLADVDDQPDSQTIEVQRASPTLTVVIDQLDESPMIQRIALELAAALRGRDTSTLRILLACRTADYPSALTDVLSSAFGDCLIADLAPLTRGEAIRLAESAGVNGNEVISAATAVGAGALAAVPLTLELLIRTYRRSRSLPPTAVEVFAEGIRQLADEHDPNRRRGDTTTSVDQRASVASRIAARAVLSGGRTVWVGPDLDAGPTDIRSGSLTGGFEQTVSGSFPVGAPEVSAALGTALFTGRGSDRLAFRHSSVAAFLAARYLLQHEVPKEQLEPLLLVAADDGSASIPTPLRELAAWYAALNPDGSMWLAEADPESLAGHSLVVESGDLRRLVVEALLNRAAEVELGDSRWLRARWKLSHPGLSDQLAAVFRKASNGEPADWPTLARIRLAVRLARDTKEPSLVDPLLDIAEDERWSAHLRHLAATAAFETAPVEAGPRLRRVLDVLADAEHARDVDPDDELRGQLLNLLWPDYVSTADIVVHLRPRRRRWFFGSYALFLRTMGDRLSEDDASLLLGWAAQGTGEDIPEVGAIGEATEDPTVSFEDPIDQIDAPIGRVDATLLDTILNRALQGEHAADRVEDVASILRRRSKRGWDMELPEPLDLVDRDGVELPASRDLRRAVALAMLRRHAATGEVDRVQVWDLVSGWRPSPAHWSTSPDDPEKPRPSGRRSLVGPSDLGWTLDTAEAAQANGDQDLADAVGFLASLIFDWQDPEAVEQVGDRIHNPAWPYVKRRFDPVQLDSPEAQRMREDFESSQPKEEPPWEGADDHIQTIRELLASARAGDATAFWRLVWNLQLDPATGKGTHLLDDDLLSFPGIPSLGADAEDAVIESAVQFLTNEHDHSQEWLGTDRYDKRAWAGYLGLSLLEQQGRLNSIQLDVWGQWCGALVWFPTASTDSEIRHRKQTLLQRAASAAPGGLAEAVTTYVQRESSRGGRPWEIELLRIDWAPALRDAGASLAGDLSDALRHARAVSKTKDPADESTNSSSEDQPNLSLPTTTESLDAALDTWEQLTTQLLGAGDDRGKALALKALEGASGSETDRPLAVVSARALLRADPSASWTLVAPLLQDPDWSRELAHGLAHENVRGAINTGLTENQLGRVYRWLSELYPPENDPEQYGVSFVGLDQEVREWRESVLGVLASRGTSIAVATLSELSLEFPRRLGIVAHLVNARKMMHAQEWQPPEPDNLARLLTDAVHRLVRTNGELAHVIVEVLAAISRDIPGHGELLWDRLTVAAQQSRPHSAEHTQETWRPKPEAALSAYLAHELELRVKGRAVVVNREVLVQPTNAYGAGDRTDILVEAPPVPDPFNGIHQTPARCAVVIEVKGVWNRAVEQDQRTQLALRYLPEANTDAGIYLIGWYPMELWTAPNDGRRADAARHRRQKLQTLLDTQAVQILSELHVHTTPILLTVPRPHATQGRGKDNSESRETDLPSSLTRPARTALVGAGYTHLDQFVEVNESQVLKIHGVGRKTLEKLRAAMEAKGTSFASEQAR